MAKREIELLDGRYLVFYTFGPDTTPPAAPTEPRL